MRSPGFSGLAAAAFLLTLLSVAACSARDNAAGEALQSDMAAAGLTQVQSRSAIQPSLAPVVTLPEAARPAFYAGKALAGQPWVKAPTTTTARDGLGPLYNARSCLACHQNGGRGKMPVTSEEVLFSGFLRLSVPGEDAVYGVVPEPVYGDQLQTQSVSLRHQLGLSAESNDAGEVQPEAAVFIDWALREFRYPDGELVTLRYPLPRVEQLAYGALDDLHLSSLRLAPSILGAGLLDLIPQTDIDAWADADDRDGNGISGRVNQVWDFATGEPAPGRFGLKANRPNVLNITAAAFAGDIGISNPLFPSQPCTQGQTRCLETPNGNDSEGIELPQALLDLVVDFVANLAAPARSGSISAPVESGAATFEISGCSGCHRPSFTTGASARYPHLSGVEIWPYSDLLLHDMGPDLADNRPDYQASGQEWRTAPLWGIAQSQRPNGTIDLLHDGRARSIEEAILWHGGEAAPARDRFVALSKVQREQLIQFVESL